MSGQKKMTVHDLVSWVKLFRALPLNNARREELYERVIRLYVNDEVSN